MNYRLIVFFFLLVPGFLVKAQSLLDSLKSIQNQGIPIAEAEARNVDGKRLFFKKGSSAPYTGVIYAKYPNGFFKTWREFENGEGHGSFINFYKNGSPSEMATYDLSRIEGPSAKFHVNGRIKERGTYRNWRVRVGVWYFYDTNGNQIKKEDYGTKGDFSELDMLLKRGAISSEFYQAIKDENEIFQ